MTSRKFTSRARLGTAMIALAIGLGSVAAPAQAAAQSAQNYRPTTQLNLSLGEGQMVSLPRNVADVWTSNPSVADVHVTTPRQINLFGKGAGEATVIATASDGSVVYATNIRVAQNLTSVNDVIRAAMPDANITVTTIGQTAVINGTVASPADSAAAEAIVRSVLNPGIAPEAPLNIVPINRLKTAVPLQVNLKVKIAEVNRSLLKELGINLLTSDPTSGFQFGVAQGGGIWLPEPGEDGVAEVVRNPVGTTLSAAGSLFGLDVLSSLDLSERDGLVTILAEPNLTALSGETASFLAGGEFPIPVSQSLGSVSIEYKQYGVGLAFTPIVLADGRISMRVRPEVSELSNEGAVELNDFVVPALTTRRAETTVELGSGQSFMIAGLLRNSTTNDVTKAPFLGDLPILGSLFRSTRFRRSETELVIIVTPYLVRPVSGQLATPIDGYRAPTDAERVWEGKTYSAPGSVPAVAAPAAPGIGASAAAAAPGFNL